MKLYDFQNTALDKIFFNFKHDEEKIILSAPTGSGKTAIALNVIDQWSDNFYEEPIYIWIAPGTGFLHKQSFLVAQKNIKINSVLIDNAVNELEKNKVYFINWEKINKKTNKLNMDSGDIQTWDTIIRNAKVNNKIVLIIDEEHLAHSDKSIEIIKKIKPDFLLRLSATPKDGGGAIIDIPEEKVIESKLIRKSIIINDDIFEGDVFDDDIAIKKGLNKQKELTNKYLMEDIKIKPLVLIQMPTGNNKEEMLHLRKVLKKYGINDSKIAVWLSDEKVNLLEIDSMDVLIFKNAIATGWDYPRAQILIKLRETGSKSFHIQTLGRIKRNQSKYHFIDDSLNFGYLYTLDNKLKNEAIKHFNGKEIKHSEIKGGFDWIKVPRSTLKRRLKNSYFDYFRKDVIASIRSIAHKNFFINNLNSINKKVIKGNEKFLTTVGIKTSASADEFRRNFWRSISNIAVSTKRVSYDDVKGILKTLFMETAINPIFGLSNKDFYSFVIANERLLTKSFIQNSNSKEEYVFEEVEYKSLPLVQKNMVSPNYALAKKAIYNDYPMNLEDSEAERSLIGFIENSSVFDFWLKNTTAIDSPINVAYSIAGEIKNFKPDFLLVKENKILVAEVKGENDIDKHTKYKYKAAREFFKSQNMEFILIRPQKGTLLYWDSEEYSENLNEYKELKNYG